MKELFCQSCGMPLETEEVMGTDKGGNKNKDYCIYCYTEGSFTEDLTMDKMIEISLKHMKEIFKDDSSFKEEEALANMKEFFPKLKRWL